MTRSDLIRPIVNKFQVSLHHVFLNSTSASFLTLEILYQLFTRSRSYVPRRILPTNSTLQCRYIQHCSTPSLSSQGSVQRLQTTLDSDIYHQYPASLSTVHITFPFHFLDLPHGLHEWRVVSMRFSEGGLGADQ